MKRIPGPPKWKEGEYVVWDKRDDSYTVRVVNGTLFFGCGGTCPFADSDIKEHVELPPPATRLEPGVYRVRKPGRKREYVIVVWPDGSVRSQQDVLFGDDFVLDPDYELVGKAQAESPVF